MPRPQRPAPAPLETNDILIAAVGTAAWVVALVTLLLVGVAPEHRWWVWVCASGIVGGIFGMWYVPRLHRKRG